MRYNQKGAAIVEFAIILPLLLLLIFGMIEFSLLMYNKAMITNASREGARRGIVYRVDPTTFNYSPLTNASDRDRSNKLPLQSSHNFVWHFDAYNHNNEGGGGIGKHAEHPGQLSLPISRCSPNCRACSSRRNSDARHHYIKFRHKNEDGVVTP